MINSDSSFVTYIILTVTLVSLFLEELLASSAIATLLAVLEEDLKGSARSLSVRRPYFPLWCPVLNCMPCSSSSRSFFMRSSSNMCSLPTLYCQFHNLLTGYPKSLQIMSLRVCESRLKAADDSLMTSVRGVRKSDVGLFWASPCPIWSTSEITGTNDFEMTVWTFCKPVSTTCGPRFIASQTASLVLGTLSPVTFFGRGYFSIVLSRALSFGCLRSPLLKMSANACWTSSPTLSSFSKNWVISPIVSAYYEGIGIESIRPILGLLHSVFVQRGERINIRFLIAAVVEGATICIIAIGHVLRRLVAPNVLVVFSWAFTMAMAAPPVLVIRFTDSEDVSLSEGVSDLCLFLLLPLPTPCGVCSPRAGWSWPPLVIANDCGWIPWPVLWAVWAITMFFFSSHVPRMIGNNGKRWKSRDVVNITL